MKKTQNKKVVVVGIFIFFAAAAFIVAVLTLGGRKQAFEKTFTLSATFNDVSGLQKGNNVWFSGVKIGTIKKLELIDNSEVKVEMKIDEKSQGFIRKDAMAKLGSDGLIGNKIVIIYGGTQSTPVVADGDSIKTEMPLNTANMMNTLQESNKNLSQITSDFKTVSRRLADGEGTVGKLLTNDSMGNQLQATIATLQYASENIRLLSANIANFTSKMQSKGSLTNDLVTDTTFFKNLKAASLQIQEASVNAKELTNNLKDVSYKIRDSSNMAGVVLQDQQSADKLKETIENIRSGTKKFDEDMEALQHNFLFRGFFRKRAKQQATQQKQQPPVPVAQTQKR